MCSRDFRDVGAGFKTRRDDPCLGLGRPAPPRRPCWNDVHTRGPLTLLPFETCFECSYFISHYDTPQTRGKHSQISAYENVGRFLRLHCLFSAQDLKWKRRPVPIGTDGPPRERKSTRLNSSN